MGHPKREYDILTERWYENLDLEEIPLEFNSGFSDLDKTVNPASDDTSFV